MNIFKNELLFKDGKCTALTKSITLKLAVLTLAFTLYVKPVPAKGEILLKILAVVLTAGIILIVDHNSCWVNLFWGCDDNGGGGGNGGAGGNVKTADGTVIEKGTVTFESDFPPSSDTNGLVAEGGKGGGTRDSLDSKPCTQGTTCPGDELGEVMVQKSTVVSPAYADSKTKMCPLFWVPGKENVQSVISCKVITNGVASPALVRNAPAGSKKNVFQIQIGKHTLSCSRTTTEKVTQYATKAGETTKTAIKDQPNVFTTTETQDVKCNNIPTVTEF
jgi:hypothetical protein